MITQLLAWIVDVVHYLGYPGILIATFIESTFIPLPSEVTMVPVGYLVYQGEMNFYLAMVCAIAGTVGGSLFNYWIAFRYGRYLFVNHGKYFLMTPKRLEKIEDFFFEHGAVSILSGRLLPGVRHYISFPAGVARMNLKRFCLYTGIGGGIWMLTLLALGYFIGQEKALLVPLMNDIIIGIAALVAISVFAYVYAHRRKRKD